MTTARALLRRVQRLETAHVPRMLAFFGGEEGWAAFEAETNAGIAAGIFDSRDMALVMHCLRRWIDAERSARL